MLTARGRFRSFVLKQVHTLFMLLEFTQFCIVHTCFYFLEGRCFYLL